jgi:hypothetical protein
MKRTIKLLLAMALVLAFVMPAQAAWRDMWANVYSWEKSKADGEMVLTKITSGITYQVLQRNSDTEETLYVYDDNAFTSLTNVVSTTNFNLADRVQFRVDPGETGDRYVDLIVTDTAGGYTAFVEDFDIYNHTIVIDERPNIVHHGMIAFAPSNNVETDTGIDFDYDTRISYVGVEVVTTDAAATIDVGLLSTGTAGDADGFINGASVATAGYPLLTLTTSGALMDDGTNFDPDGHIVKSADEQSLTYTGSAGSDTAAGYIHYWFTRMR